MSSQIRVFIMPLVHLVRTKRETLATAPLYLIRYSRAQPVITFLQDPGI
jgi:hypothetical protein